jgi:ubiquinone/menaquinone biosynthesis C-methylase UbiE
MEQIKMGQKMTQQVILNVGCGKTPLKNQTKAFDGWKELRVDSYDNETVDVISSITDLKEIEDESVDALWACHVVEHCYWHDLPKVFNSMVRVLKKDGFAVIRVPDLASIADKIKDGLLETIYDSEGGDICVIDMIYSHRGLVEKYGEGMAHKTGFTPKSMSQVLQSLNIQALVANRGFEVVAILYKDKKPEKFLNTEGCII